MILFFDKALLALGNVRLSFESKRDPSSAPNFWLQIFCFAFDSLLFGQLLFLLGITLLIGAKKTIVFFSRRSKWRGTACFLGGISMVLFGWPVFGMLIEIFGIFNLFGSDKRSQNNVTDECVRATEKLMHNNQNCFVSTSLTLVCVMFLIGLSNFFPIVLSIFRNLPVIGPVLNLPIIQKVRLTRDNKETVLGGEAWWAESLGRYSKLNLFYSFFFLFVRFWIVSWAPAFQPIWTQLEHDEII